MANAVKNTLFSGIWVEWIENNDDLSDLPARFNNNFAI
jgi:hypothetical protein